MIAYGIGFIPQGNLFTVYGEDGLEVIFDDKTNSLDILPEVIGLTPYPSPTMSFWAWASRGKTGLWVTKDNRNLVELSQRFMGASLWSEDG